MKNRIKELRINSDIRLEALSKILGITTTSLRKFEKGEGDIPSSIIIKVSKLFDKSTDYILCQTTYQTEENTQEINKIKMIEKLKSVVLYEKT